MPKYLPQALQFGHFGLESKCRITIVTGLAAATWTDNFVLNAWRKVDVVTRYNGVNLAKLPFQPASLIRKLSQRNLDHPAVDDCAFVSLHPHTSLPIACNWSLEECRVSMLKRLWECCLENSSPAMVTTISMLLEQQLPLEDRATKAAVMHLMLKLELLKA